MIQKEIQTLKMSARKGRDPFLVNLFSFIQGEFERVSKDVPDAKAIKILEELLEHYHDRAAHLNDAERKEMEIVQELVTKFKPTQLTEEATRTHVQRIVSESTSGEPATIGVVQRFFKDNFPGQYDAKLVTSLFKGLQ